MPLLRHAHLIARFVLVWFALSLGVAIASPMVKPQAMQLVCSSAGAIKVVVGNDDAGTSGPTLTLDCPLCAGLGSVPPLVLAEFALAAPLPHAVPVQAPLPICGLAAAPPPARGPPALL